MFLFEKCARTIRHLPVLRKINLFWNLITPAYEYTLKAVYGNALRRLINNTDVVYVPHCLRHFTDTYETDFWKMAMNEARLGDTVADVGAFFGFYTFAFAKRVGLTGKVVAFEPDPHNVSFLRNIVKRYKLSLKPQIVGSAVGQAKGMLRFDAQGSFTSGVILKGIPKGEAREVECVSLDEFFANEKLDIIKIDVEGYEEKVLLGSRNILSRKSGHPRAIFIEVHPYAWDNYGTTDKAIITILNDAGYRVQNANGDTVSAIKDYGNIVAMKD